MAKRYFFDDKKLCLSDGERAHTVFDREQVEAIKFIVKSMIGDNNKKTAQRTAEAIKTQLSNELKKLNFEKDDLY